MVFTPMSISLSNSFIINSGLQNLICEYSDATPMGSLLFLFKILIIQKEHLYIQPKEVYSAAYGDLSP